MSRFLHVTSDYGLSFDDVLLRPQRGILEKREHADISTEVVAGLKIEVPIISSPMASVTERDMAAAMYSGGAYGIIHRFLTISEQQREYQDALMFGRPAEGAAIAIGINDEEPYKRWEILLSAGCKVFCLDVAHAHHDSIAKFIQGVPDDLRKESKLIVGNVATAFGARFLADIGVDAIKVGIGPGAACTTREVTGFGVPQLTAIMDVADALNQKYPKYPHVKIIADGGIKTSGDIVKALAAGADTVMLGRLLAGADESPHPGLYWGMASKRVNGHHAPEGIEGVVDRTGPVSDTLKNLAWGIRSGLSYAGATNLKELRDNAVFIRVTPMSMGESGTRL